MLASALFRFSNYGYAHAVQQVRSLPPSERQRLALSLLGAASKFDIPLRELEHSTYTFELVLDQGAYFEFKRHRMMAQTAQPLSTHLGYAMPSAFAAAGMESAFRQAMDLAQETFEKLEGFNPEVASYVVPNAYRRRVLFTTNLRSLDHFIALRSAPNAHFSMRRVAHRVEHGARAAPEGRSESRSGGSTGPLGTFPRA